MPRHRRGRGNGGGGGQKGRGGGRNSRSNKRRPGKSNTVAPKQVDVLCGVCKKVPPKYKCPICELRYCSLPCYKTHKQTPCERKKTTEGEDEPQKRPPGPLAVSVIIPKSKLETLAQSPQLREMLRNKHLRTLLTNIDSSDDPNRELKKALPAAIFREFVDATTTILNPKGRDL